MNRRNAFFLVTASTALILGASAFVFSPDAFLLADDACLHQGYHYQANAATASDTGNLEFWTCCKCHDHFLSKPEKGNFVDNVLPESIPEDVVIPPTEKIAVNSCVLTFNGVNYTESTFVGSREFASGAPAPSWKLTTNPAKAAQYVDIWITKNEIPVVGWPTEVGDYVFCVGILSSNEYVKFGSSFTRNIYVSFSIVEAAKIEPTITFSIENGAHVKDNAALPTVSVSEGVNYSVTYSSDALHVEGLPAPTTTGVTWSIVVQTEENEFYTAKKDWRWFYYDHEEEPVSGTQLTMKDFDKPTRAWGNDGNQGVDGSFISESDGVIDFKIDAANRKGSALESKEYYGSGSISMDAKFSKTTGICYALWTFYYADNGNVNHELDIEVYDNNKVVYSSYTSETLGSHEYEDIDSLVNDGKYHNYKISWVGGSYVKYYVDNQLRATITSHVPDHSMKIWIGAWCPSWAGETMDGTYHMYVKNIQYVAAE